MSDEDLVLSQARALDKIPHDQRGRLHGVAIAIKDIMDTKGRRSPLIIAILLTRSRHAHRIWFSFIQG